MIIGIIGAGWYGCHLARVLQAAGYEVKVFERNPRIFSGISGEFGVRCHKGPHYPRSEETRKGCRRGFKKFHEKYHDLLVRHGHSIYALGIEDADGLPPKVNKEQFEAVCRESKDCRQILPSDSDWHYENLHTVMDIKEPSIILGERLRETFETLLKEEGITVQCNTEVTKLESCEDGVIVYNRDTAEKFDYVINATSYHDLLPVDSLPFDMQVVYQPCLALIYEDMQSTDLPFSFITLDGFFPCIMPVVRGDPLKEKKEGHRKYMVTHGKWTILGSYPSRDKAQADLDKIDNDFVNEKIKPNCESSLHSFWPEFTVEQEETSSQKNETRFKYIGWQSAILAKIPTNREFRSAMTFEKDRVIYVIPGKVSNIFDVAKEVKSLVGLKKAVILNKDGYTYVQNGVLDAGTHEIIEPIDSPERNTCMLQTYEELQQKDEEKVKENGEKELNTIMTGEKHQESENSTLSPKNKKLNRFNLPKNMHLLSFLKKQKRNPDDNKISPDNNKISKERPCNIL